jgi:hypothetical protein
MTYRNKKAELTKDLISFGSSAIPRETWDPSLSAPFSRKVWPFGTTATYSKYQRLSNIHTQRKGQILWVLKKYHGVSERGKMPD